MNKPQAPPPTYDDAIKARSGIPPMTRRSMEDESRPLPTGWVRQYDVEHGHQFFVDTRADPPHSIWHHPYDDKQYMSTLTANEREHIQSLYKSPSQADIEAESTDEDGEHHKSGKHAARPSGAHASSSAAGPSSLGEKKGLGQKMKDKLTGSTHEERVLKRQKREEDERQAYEQHMVFRSAMRRALETGQPQNVGKDKNGHDLYIEPPSGPQNIQYGFPGSRPQGNYISPYSSGIYTDPNARFIRPQNTYSRPYGSGYGGGLGLPLAAGLGGGLLFGGLMGGGMMGGGMMGGGMMGGGL